MESEMSEFREQEGAFAGGKLKRGIVQVFWGNGRGKTTAALGTALRACGNGLRVHLVQFMKKGASSVDDIPGEIKALAKFSNFSWARFGSGEWVTKKGAEARQEDLREVKKALEHVANALTKNFDVVIADEILYAVQLGLLTEEDVLELIDKKPDEKELILTGSHVPLEKVFAKAELVTEIRKLKHPYDSGILARKGIDY
ncbi:cobalamin adenosyltransferase [Candidatus Pacearchaeota archaeon]|nr:MAG: cobalamin adenosyltransferase [Candidatus Pacearchaeota archaeon]